MQGLFVLHSSFDVKLREKGGKAGRESDIFILDGNPLNNVKKILPLPPNCLHPEDAPHVCFVFIHS